MLPRLALLTLTLCIKETFHGLVDFVISGPSLKAAALATDLAALVVAAMVLGLLLFLPPVAFPIPTGTSLAAVLAGARAAGAASAAAAAPALAFPAAAALGTVLLAKLSILAALLVLALLRCLRHLRCLRGRWRLRRLVALLQVAPEVDGLGDLIQVVAENIILVRPLGQLTRLLTLSRLLLLFLRTLLRYDAGLDGVVE
mmetsp:Transcript_13809/g.30100  ORF Transcript_13809/g.30100 Transcript_13809/m.30100 type:complete len:200 (-) Transcript_13809:2605-3204(-)